MFRGLLVGSQVWKNVGWGTIIYLAALSGVILAARMGSAQGATGAGYEMGNYAGMDADAAAILQAGRFRRGRHTRGRGFLRARYP